jgi:hypothetical protein
LNYNRKKKRWKEVRRKEIKSQGKKEHNGQKLSILLFASNKESTRQFSCFGAIEKEENRK